MRTLAVGDVVRLRSGGPEMMVRRVDRWRNVTCSYARGAVQQLVSFPAVCLHFVRRAPLRRKR
jgi:uncharacterized protein YodC (DUF2158 family)